MYEIKKIGLVRPMGNTLGVRPMGNSEANGQHFFEKHVCCPLVSPTVVCLPIDNCVDKVYCLGGMLSYKCNLSILKYIPGDARLR